MWTMLFLLWIIPIAIGVLAFARAVDGMPALKNKERELLFDETKTTELGFWLGLTFAVLAVAFFGLGLIQGIILPNLGSFWFVTVPLMTGGAAILLLALWLRSAPPHSRRFQKRISRIQTRATRIADILFR
ncbi:MAG: hypothetical protein ACREP3_15365 [Candidatus Binatia bacterium]